MGIRFTCPQGHSLNVKAELAGKRGVCPQCGAKVQIPIPEAKTSPQNDPIPTVVVPSPTDAAQEKLPSAPVVEPVAPKTVVQAPVAEAAPVVAASPPAEETSSSGLAGEEAWYVRPPGGGQFGPASRADFAQWIFDGRVVPEAYVWRVGWADWKHAREVGNELPAPLPVVATAAVPVSVVPAPAGPTAVPMAAPVPQPLVVPEKTSITAKPFVRRKQSANQQMLIVSLLLIITAILGGILWWVLTRSPTEVTQNSTCPSRCDVLG